MVKRPYYAEVGDEGCACCHHNRFWIVIGPLGDVGIPFNYESDAFLAAEELNKAYFHGHRDAEEGR